MPIKGGAISWILMQTLRQWVHFRALTMDISRAKAARANLIFQSPPVLKVFAKMTGFFAITLAIMAV
ncbi:hypothetical protein Q1695_000111 [Nippostrongylus brasiliensis]|nr:hypothetical protein Q1695_000111 [Nippostrongylus brasiliensis]